MKALLAVTILAISVPLALLSEPSTAPQPFPYAQSWKISSSSGGHGSMVPVSHARGGMVFLTAKHVARNIGPMAQASHPEYGVIRTGIRVLKSHPTLDLATIFVPVLDSRIRPVRIGRIPALGAKVVVVAYPAPGRRRITSGHICGPLRMSAQITFGSSGGPVFDMHGRLIGVVRAVDVSRQGIPMGWQGYYTQITPALLRLLL